MLTNSRRGLHCPHSEMQCIHHACECRATALKVRQAAPHPEYDMTATVAFCPAPSRSKPTSSIVLVVSSGRCGREVPKGEAWSEAAAQKVDAHPAGMPPKVPPVHIPAAQHCPPCLRIAQQVEQRVHAIELVEGHIAHGLLAHCTLHQEGAEVMAGQRGKLHISNHMCAPLADPACHSL